MDPSPLSIYTYAMNIYLDIDGVLVNKEGQPSPYVDEFIRACVDSRAELYWLTTWCRTSDEAAIRHLRAVGMKPESIALLQEHCKPTNWDANKTDAIDFDKPFYWFDDVIFEEEYKTLEMHQAIPGWIKIDLKNFPNQLKECIELVEKLGDTAE